jgi:dTDP-4-dehydrorhamnose 3,5-epimerase
MKVVETKLRGVLIIEPKIFGDQRGFFKESFQVQRYSEAGINLPFVQDNYSRSQKGVLRGLHFQKTRPQGKLVSCTSGVVFDVAVDIDPFSDSFGEYVAVHLSEDNHLQLWIPPGYAHGFCVLSDYADFNYKCTEFYYPEDEDGLIWNDPDVNINWPIDDPLLSEKDKTFKNLADFT